MILFCRQSVDPATDLARAAGLARNCVLRMVALPCSSKVEVPHIMRVLEDGADGVLVVACPEHACRFMVGNTRAEKRINYARGLLETVGMGAERLALARGAKLSAEALAELGNSRGRAVEPLGANPLRRRK
ncbi:MAG: hydrogenase iron-sulfur subunit [Pseudomonadota bacterium]